MTPMFPLGSVLLPGMSLSLRIFEERYQRMLSDVLEDDRTFGTVLIERGNEVGGGDVRADVGTLVRLTDHRHLGGGHHSVVGYGIERIRVDEWLPDDPYPRAHTSLLPDEDRDDDSEDLSESYRSCTTALRELFETAAAHGHRSPPPDFPTLDDPWQGTYLLIELAPLGPFDRQRLLRLPTTSERIRSLGSMIEDQMYLITGGGRH